MVSRSKVIWDIEARNSFKQAIHWIRSDSPVNADKVKKYFLVATRSLVARPEIHPPDKYCKNHDQRFRAFEKYNFRVVYFIAEDSIRILRFRHVKQEPLEY